MQATIRIRHTSRELPLEASDSQGKVLVAVADTETKVAILSGNRDRKVLVPVGSPAYIEFGEAKPHRVDLGI